MFAVVTVALLKVIVVHHYNCSRDLHYTTIPTEATIVFHRFETKLDDCPALAGPGSCTCVMSLTRGFYQTARTVNFLLW